MTPNQVKIFIDEWPNMTTEQQAAALRLRVAQFNWSRAIVGYFSDAFRTGTVGTFKPPERNVTANGEFVYSRKRTT